MIRNILLSFVVIFAFSSTAFSAHHEEKGVQKAKEKTEKVAEQTDQKAEADAALKKVEAMTREARGKNEGKDKKPEKKK